MPLLAIALAVLLALPAAAAARPAEPLQDLAPASTAFVDRVLTEAPKARASARPFRAYPLADGRSVRIRVSRSYTGADAVARSYAGFLDSLPHGDEISDLRVEIATPAEVRRACGSKYALACYTTGDDTMTVPGEQVSDRAGVTTSYVIAHEYGHHLAHHRSNAPFPAIAYGPKHWASQRRVCAGVLAKRLAPGDQGAAYGANPGEAWAETYAQLKYPDVAWAFTPRLRPTAGALAAARRDVTDPWTRRVVATYAGELSGDVTRQAFSFELRLDGALSFRLDGPDGAHYDLRVASGGKTMDTTRARGSDDVIRYAAACRDRAVEKVRVTVLRRSGSGPFRLSVRYAG